VARRARGFSMHVLYHSPRPLTPEEDEGAEWVDLDTLLTTSDFVSVHVPLTPETHGLIGTAALARMRPEAILVNTARGPIVDSVALFEALSSGRIAAAALDVTDPEPLPPDSPLLTLPNCLIVPHIGSATRQTRRRMAELAAENLVAGLRGLPLPHCVNPDARQGAS
jgi:phosphoglycerate dehydrogenase-like enzyme